MGMLLLNLLFKVLTFSSHVVSKQLIKGKKRPLAPSCHVSLVRADLTTVLCQLTSSIYTRGFDNDDDESPKEVVKEIFICFRPLTQRESEGEELVYPIQKMASVNQDNNVTEPSSDTTSNGNEKTHMPMKKRPFETGEVTLTSGESLTKKYKGKEIKKQSSNCKRNSS
jgi:hypothetical protein